MMNPSISNKDFNPILHTKGYHNPTGNVQTTAKDYGSIPSRQANHPQ